MFAINSRFCVLFVTWQLEQEQIVNVPLIIWDTLLLHDIRFACDSTNVIVESTTICPSFYTMALLAISINRQGYGFVQYSDEDAAQQALSENGAQVKSCTLQVKPCSVNDLRKKRRDRSRSRSPLPTTPQRYGNE